MILNGLTVLAFLVPLLLGVVIAMALLAAELPITAVIVAVAAAIFAFGFACFIRGALRR